MVPDRRSLMGCGADVTEGVGVGPLQGILGPRDPKGEMGDMRVRTGHQIITLNPSSVSRM